MKKSEYTDDAIGYDKVSYNFVHDVALYVDLGAVLDVCQQNVLQRFPRDIRHNLTTNFSKVPVKDSLHDSLSAMHPAPLYKAKLAILVHVFGESSHERLIG